jgi:hypothetical protein
MSRISPALKPAGGTRDLTKRAAHVWLVGVTFTTANRILFSRVSRHALIVSFGLELWRSYHNAGNGI